MIFDHGSFHLDGPGRKLRLDGREAPLQPRVFDLLVYLVTRRDKVVTKEELLEALWPGVLVTDNSLQRAISLLRMTLRKVGMEHSIRNFPRKGYRFCIDENEGKSIAPASSDVTRHEAAAAAADWRWSDAARLFACADSARALEGHDLATWATALFCLGHPARAAPIFARAVASHAAQHNYEEASASAVALATIHLERGEIAVARGWVSRAEDLVSGLPGSPAVGKALWMRSRIAGVEGQPERALALAQEAYEAGRRSGSPQVEALGLLYRGFFRLSLGETAAGLADQDHAAALALSSNIDPMTGGTLYCNILWACRTFNDWSRANQWTLGYQRFCHESGLQFSGACQLHRAEVLSVCGALCDAVCHIEEAIAKLIDDTPWAVGDAYRVLGDIQSALGDDDAALAAYQKCESLGWDPEPGLAMLRLDHGDPDAARTGLQRSLIGQSWWALQRRGILLAHLAIVCAKSRREPEALAIISELLENTERWPMPAIRAFAEEAKAYVHRREGESEQALRHLLVCQTIWTDMASRFHLARIRIELSDLFIERGEYHNAAVELRIARTAAQDLNSLKLTRLCDAVQSRL